ncbi:MAG: flagellar hook-basal body complex protein FliE [Oscillospiraceae bacterium]|nr:flagellar hook-basal body complex protein FliE [Oscillospiraceae bacterium]
MYTIFQPISPLWESFPITGTAENAAASSLGGSIFTDIFKATINNVREAEDTVAKTEYLLSTGQLDNPSEVGIAQWKADAATQLLIQLRDKVLSAYSDLTRMSV